MAILWGRPVDGLEARLAALLGASWGALDALWAEAPIIAKAFKSVSTSAPAADAQAPHDGPKYSR